MAHVSQGTRRQFLQLASLGAASIAVAGRGVPAADAAAEATAAKRPLKLALASYTLRKFDLDQTIAMTRRVGLEAICLKSFHLPLETPADQIAAAAAKIRQAGLDLYGGGVITMKTAAQVDQAFEYAKAAGMTHIIAAPTPEMLPRIEQQVQQYDLFVCIHNHGPGDNLFPTPTVAYEKIQGLDRRIGLCHDVGHTVRYGEDAIAANEKCASRLYDVHIKDVTEASKAGHSTPCGRGVIDLPRLLRGLAQAGFGGYLAFEYEEEADDPLPGLAECVGYVRGVLDTM